MNGTTNPGYTNNPEPPYTSGKDGISDTDFELITKVVHHLGLAADWFDEIEGDYPSTWIASKKIGEALDLLRSLI